MVGKREIEVFDSQAGVGKYKIELSKHKADKMANIILVALLCNGLVTVQEFRLLRLPMLSIFLKTFKVTVSHLSGDTVVRFA